MANILATPDTRASAPVALVTGAGRRIGRVVAQTLFARGYRLALAAHTSIDELSQLVDEITMSGGEALALQADLRDTAQVDQLVAGAHNHYGRIDALVNCAAIWRRQALETITAEDVREHFEVNTLATFLCCQKVGLVMVAQEQGGAIVNLGDWATIRPYRDYAAYFPSKGTIPTLTRSLAVELAHRNPRVRVNAVLPGPVLLGDNLSPAEKEAIIEATLVKREGTPANIAHAVVFLLENDFVTGVCLPVDGGRGIHGSTR